MSNWNRLAIACLIAVTSITPAAKAQELSDRVTVDADRIEFSNNNRSSIATGDVIVTSGDIALRAPRITIWLSPSANSGSESSAQRAIATGGVEISAGPNQAVGDLAVYDFGKKLAILSGNVVVTRDEDVVRGERVVLNLETGLASISGVQNRVTGEFTVPDQ